MKRFYMLLAALLIAGMAAAQTVKVTNGQPVNIRITTGVSSKSERISNISAIIENNVYDSSHERVVVKRGTPVNLSSQIVKAKGLGKPGSIRIDCLSTTAVDGQTINLIGGINVEGDDNKGVAIGCGVGLGVTILCPIGFLFFLIKGENVEVPANTIIQNVVINDTYKIAVK